ncbi:MAG: hypothetical protein B0D92_06660 [Spirochaeta sp. LUC14_002_19_P3]|nr:MAG: hypothetical protein B0D92_06660 [Spirochaeta sp. LUC14_002_19_P3]
MNISELINEEDLEQDESLFIDTEKLDMLPNGILLKLQGQLHSFNSRIFHAKIIQLIKIGYLNLVFDATRLNYISSTGVGAFTLIMKELTARNGSMILASLQPSVYHVFDLLGFENYFNFQENWEKAISSYCLNKDDKTIFPIIFRCPACFKRQKAVCNGQFRCADCKTILTVQEDGEVGL